MRRFEVPSSLRGALTTKQSCILLSFFLDCFVANAPRNDEKVAFQKESDILSCLPYPAIYMYRLLNENIDSNEKN